MDFLQNHDAANRLAMPVYVQNYGGRNETAAAGQLPPGSSMDECLAALEAACGPVRGGSFGCMACADEHRDKVALGPGPLRSRSWATR